MTAHARKSWRNVALWGFSALLTGAATMMAFVIILMSSSLSPDAPLIVAEQNIPFPEDREALDALTDKLARDGAAMAHIEPAAGRREK